MNAVSVVNAGEISMFFLLTCASAAASGITDASAPNPGHIFLLNTDLRHLACDAWLCPTDEQMSVDPLWRLGVCEIPAQPAGWGSTCWAIRCNSKTEAGRNARQALRYRQYDHPQPFLGLCLQGRSSRGLTVPMLMATLRDFLAQVLVELGGSTSRFGRALPLIGVPLFGSGFASDNFLLGSDQSGEIVLAMLEELDTFTRTHAVDVALCTVDSAAFSAAQTARRRLLGERRPDRYGRLWRLKPPLDADAAQYEAEVERLSSLFLSSSGVSLFLGAGVSINAGLPSWSQLIDLLADALGLHVAERTALAELNPLEVRTRTRTGACACTCICRPSTSSPKVIDALTQLFSRA